MSSSNAPQMSQMSQSPFSKMQVPHKTGGRQSKRQKQGGKSRKYQKQGGKSRKNSRRRKPRRN